MTADPSQPVGGPRRVRLGNTDFDPVEGERVRRSPEDSFLEADHRCFDPGT